jgi:amino acid adenylation domain-containing protein
MSNIRIEGTGPVSLTPQQKRMIFLHEVDVANVAYNTGTAFRLRGNLQPDRLRQALRLLVERTDLLRTSFGLVEGVPTAWLRRHADLDWRYVDAREAARGAGGFDGLGALRDTLAERMNLLETSLRVALLRTSDDEWLLAIIMHHIVCDGWSFGIFIEELCAAYNAPDDAQPASGVVPYEEYARWFEKQRTRKAYTRSVEQLGDALKGAPPCLELSWDRPRPALQTYRGELDVRRLAPGLVADVRAFAEKEQVTPFVVLYAAYLALLRRFSNQRDLVVGVPVANRQRSEFSRTLGFFVNTLPLRCQLEDSWSCRELLACAHSVLLDSLDHQMGQIEDIIDHLRLPRDASYPPIYQVLFAFQNAPAAEASFRGLRATQLSLGSVGAKADLTLNLDVIDETLLASWEFNADLFDRASVARMADSYEWILRQLVERPELKLRDIEAVPPAERGRLLAACRSEPLAYPDVSTFVVIQERARRGPDAPALVWKEEVWTYSRLLQRSAVLAGLLSDAGVRRGDVVGVFAERSPQLVAGLLAIWQVGAAYVPLDPSYPLDRIGYMLEDSGATAVLTSEGAVVPATSKRLVVIGLEADGVAGAAFESSAGASASPSDLAYIIYTSGSTGRPKGVCIEHRSVVAFLAWAAHAYGDHLSNVLASTSICFDLSVFELFAPLAAGGTVTLVRDALELAELREPPPVVLLNLVHSALAELIRLKAVPKTVKVVNFGGELPSNDTAQAAYALGHVERTYNVYGPTEDTVYSMSFCIERGSREVPGIGRSIPNSQAYILDEGGKLAPIGVTGELYLAGAGLARCYHGRPELTAERFVEIDVGKKVRAYRTGDLSRRKPNGEVVFLGRRDHQVKVRGYRVELGEVDQALLKYPGVRAAVSTTYVDRTGERLIVGYVVSESGAAALERIRESLAQWLPAYMVPSHVIELPELPLTPNGKVARDRLPAVTDAQGSGGRLRDGSLEPLVARLFEELLQASGVGADDEFFSLGGHSLLAARLAASLQKELGVSVSIRDIFRLPRVSRLAAELELRLQEAALAAPSAASDLGVKGVELDDFPGYHVNCFYHCLIQALNYFEAQPIHGLNLSVAAFLPYENRFAGLDPDQVSAATLYREVRGYPAESLETNLTNLFGMNVRRFRLDGDLAPLVAALRDGEFPILVGGTDEVVEPSVALVQHDPSRGHFVALANDFGQGFKTVPFDSPRLRAGEEVVVIRPSSSTAGKPTDNLETLWVSHVAKRRANRDAEIQSFVDWRDKYERRQLLPELRALLTELEGVNVTLGSELSGFLRFERFVAERLPPRLQTPALRAYVELIERTLSDYQRLANALRRALMTAEDLPAATLNTKIVEALKLVETRQRDLTETLLTTA